MQKWEYFTEFIYASVDAPGWEKYRQDNMPDFKPYLCSPRTMIPHLNKEGEDGWELVHMQPIAGVDDDATVIFPGQEGTSSNAYFCVWKRPKQ